MKCSFVSLNFVLFQIIRIAEVYSQGRRERRQGDTNPTLPQLPPTISWSKIFFPL